MLSGVYSICVYMYVLVCMCIYVYSYICIYIKKTFDDMMEQHLDKKMITVIL
jgi:hypothetical protein